MKRNNLVRVYIFVVVDWTDFCMAVCEIARL